MLVYSADITKSLSFYIIPVIILERMYTWKWFMVRDCTDLSSSQEPGGSRESSLFREISAVSGAVRGAELNQPVSELNSFTFWSKNV